MSRSGMSPYIICWGALAAWLAPGGAWLSWGGGVLLPRCRPLRSCLPEKARPKALASPYGQCLCGAGEREGWGGSGVEDG